MECVQCTVVTRLHKPEPFLPLEGIAIPCGGCTGVSVISLKKSLSLSSGEWGEWGP